MARASGLAEAAVEDTLVAAELGALAALLDETADDALAAEAAAELELAPEPEAHPKQASTATNAAHAANFIALAIHIILSPKPNRLATSLVKQVRHLADMLRKHA